MKRLITALKKLTVSQSGVLGGMVVVLVYFLLWQAMITPHKNETRLLQEQLTTELKTQQIQLKALEVLVKQTRKNQQKNAEKFQKIKAYSQGDINLLLQKLFARLPVYNATLLQIKKTGLQKGHDAFRYSTVDFVLSGSYKDLSEYMFFLYSQPILFKLRRVVLKPDPATPGNLLMTVNINLFI